MPRSGDQASTAETLVPGDRVGRYIIIGVLGKGGMGVVYAAYDPELDRKIALKLLHVKLSAGMQPTEARSRLLREAQATAKLSHPNVIVVYDVGMYLDQVFLAMEFVDGTTVAAWLRAAPRGWREVLKLFTAAGRGLAAAHDAGFVHRDFKPENVMVAADGQIRVMDFGLARQVEDGKDRKATPRTGTPPRRGPIQLPPEASGPLGSRLSLVSPSEAFGIVTGEVWDPALTRAGSMMGTPAYMSPEQFADGATDGRTDQFSFCVATYEGLYGERPFSGKTIFGLTGNVMAGNVIPAPAGTKVPPWVRRVLLRGLRPAPDERWPSMRALLEALEKDPAVRRRRWLTVAAVAASLLAVAAGVKRAGDSQRSFCAAAPEKLVDVWELPPKRGSPETPRKLAVRNAFLASGKSYAGSTFRAVSGIFDRYVRAWAAMYTEACEATHVRGEQSAEVLDLRMSCLQERLGGVRALTQLFSEADGEMVGKAVEATNALGTLDRCADVKLLRAVVKPPEDPQLRKRVEQLRQETATIRALRDAGRYKAALGRAERLGGKARETGYSPLLAESLELLGVLQVFAGDAKTAETTLEEAMWAAEATHHDQLAGEISVELMWVVGYLQSRFEEGKRWGHLAEAHVRRIGGNQVLEASLLNNLGILLHRQKKLDEALTAHRKVLAVREKLLRRDHPDVALTLGNIAIVLDDLGRLEEALSSLDRATAIVQKELGADHPELARHLSNRGEILNKLGRHQEATSSFERSLKIARAELIPGHPIFLYALTGLGKSRIGSRDPDRAIEALEQTLEIDRLHAAEPFKMAEARFALAQALSQRNRGRDRAIRSAQRARDIYSEGGGHSKEVDEISLWLSSMGSSQEAMSPKERTAQLR
jgi:serine/threonine protein kinase/tetratricopeptide (TPR) repeat protein